MDLTSAVVLAQTSSDQDIGKAVDKAVPDKLSFGDWLQAGITVAVTIVLAIVAHRLVMRLNRHGDGDSQTIRLLARIVSSAIVVVGVLIALKALMINLGPLLAGLGIVGLVIAFAVQDVAANYIAGLLIGIRRPFRIGDQIASQEQEGTVEGLNFRYTTLLSYDGTRVLLPNAGVFGNPLTNFTVNGRRRTTVCIGVAYDTDVEEAKQVLCDAASGCEGVLANPEPVAWMEVMGASSLDIALLFWHDPPMADVWQVRDRVLVAALHACGEAGIEIPFPRRVVEVRSADDPEPGED